MTATLDRVIDTLIAAVARFECARSGHEPHLSRAGVVECVNCAKPLG